MTTVNGVQAWVAQLDRRAYSLLVGLLLGLGAGGAALLLALGGPIIAFGAVLGVLAGLYVLSNLNAALYGMVAIMALLPFGTLPFRIAFTPTLLDMALGAFLLVYLAQWMTGKRRGFKLTPVHLLIALYIGWLILSFLLGLRYARPTSANLRQFAEMLLSIGMAFVVVDLLREPAALRRLAFIFIVAAGMQALAALLLYITPDETAERLLIRLARIGYPNGGVIRYIEDNPALSERAIGTWVDPNALGGFLTVAASFTAPQLFARLPLIHRKWMNWALLGVLALALLLTYSRASMLAFAAALLLIGLVRGYRRFLSILVIGALLFLILPQTRGYVERLLDAFTASDLATQMRLGEYGDSLELISRYPIAGVGFTGTPEIDLYTDVASMYLIMANQIGLVGVFLFALAMVGVFLYGWQARGAAWHNPALGALHLGAHAALLAALVNATADLYFFRLDFQSSIFLFWLIVGVCLATSRLALIPTPNPSP